MGVFNKLCVLLAVIVSINSLPLRTRINTVTFPSEDIIATSDFNYSDIDVSAEVTNSTEVEEASVEVENDPTNSSEILNDSYELINDVEFNSGASKNNEFMLTNQIREGMVVTSYVVTLEPNVLAGTFSATATIRLQVDLATVEDPLIFYADEMNINSVRLSAGAGTNFVDAADVDLDDGILEIDTGLEATLYTVIIEYTGSLEEAGIGLYSGSYETDTYVAMNLHPTNARRVFPCIDEPNVHTTISFNFAGVNNYQHIISNSILADTSTANEVQFTPLPGVPHLWGMVAHNLNAVNIPITNVVLYARPGRSNQDAQANVAINNFFSALNQWTGKEYESIIANQEGRLHIMAMPDIDREWYALSTICIWEPYVLMDTAAAVSQRETGLQKIAEALARQWFGFVMVPANWKFQWVVSGLGSYAAHQIVKDFQTDPLGLDESLIDMNAVFVSDIIQESLLNDAYTNALPLEPSDDLFDEDLIRDNINGLLKTKAPAILNMLSLVLSQNPENDYIKDAASALLQTDALSNINSRNFYDTLISFWNNEPNRIIEDVLDFLDSWVLQNNYPLIRVDLRQGGVVVTQERFGYSSRPQINYMIPITYTTSINPNFDNIYPIMVMETTQSFDMVLDEEDWVLFNVQGQGYYRVNYDNELWERIIEVLEDPDQREQIHPINRATLVDDALNLARAGKVDYEIAFRVVLTMEHETEYVVWKAFVRSMEFLRVRLLAYVDDDEDLDPDIYLRMVRRTVGRLEDELSFTPELNVNEPSMTSLARGLVMYHACRVGYQPCIAAAIDWFRDPNNRDAVNPNIPADIRPAVYCGSVMSGGEEERELLFEYLNTVNNAHERVVVLESLACSQDNNFIQSFLDETIAANSPYNTEERSRIFKAVVSSTSTQNSRIALNFLSQRTMQIRNMYGGSEKLEDIVHTMAKHLGDRDMTNDFVNWVNSLFSDLDDSLLTAERAREQAQQDALWDSIHLDYVYEWIDENDAHTTMVSMIVITLGLFVALFNQF